MCERLLRRASFHTDLLSLSLSLSPRVSMFLCLDNYGIR
jgi:hypothetical protein